MRKLVFIAITLLLLQMFSSSVAATNGAKPLPSEADVVEEVAEEVSDDRENDPSMGENEEDKAESEDENTEEKSSESVEVEDKSEQAEEKSEPVEEEELAQEKETVKSKSIFSKTSRPNAIPGIMSGSDWGEPGSLKLEKDAEATDTYAEWEVELKVQGKNLKTSSDIVLVFDRSNSMNEGNREQKAKNAAKEFVNNLLIDENSTVRIALVPFGSDTGTDNDPHTDFQGFSGKQTLLDAIDAIQIYSNHQSGGTNIHVGLHAADEMLEDSTADKKTIVLLSDGAPTYSMKAEGYEKPYSWSGGRHDFILKDFDYTTRVGNGTAGNRPNYDLGPYRCGVIVPRTCYEVEVRDHVIPTISEAKHIMNSGIDIYSIGLEVGNVADAIYTLQHSQNKGYYQGGSDDMAPIFEEIAASLVYPATNSIVTDPLGEKFNLVKDSSYNGANFKASHGTATWDEASETFTWNIGSIKEGEVYTLKYKVTIDWDTNPKGNVKYPTNKQTPLNYKDPEGVDKTKQFPIPKVGISTGKIVKIGYKVNFDGDPVDADGNVVTDISLAEQFYTKVHGEDLPLGQEYDVHPNDVTEYTLHVGANPTNVTIDADEPFKVVYFGYVKTDELIAGDVTAMYVDDAGNEIAVSEVHSGLIGEQYTTEQKDIPGYEFEKIVGAPESGTFKQEEQLVTYVYTKKLGSLTVIKVDEEGERLGGAKFKLKDENGNIINEIETNSNGEIVFENLDWGKYTLVETKAPAGFRKLIREIEVEITVENLNITKTVVNSEADWEIPATGGIGTLGYYTVGLLLIGIASWLILRNRRRSL